jgi:S-adenosylmethionine:tRNA ribosyltransferase-isomerase
MDSSELDYDLPSELIAQHPAERRDASRLLVYDRSTGDVRHRTFAELPEELSGELAVVNDTRVVPARIRIERPRGEVLLLEPEGDGTWLALARPTRRLKPGDRHGAVELLEHLGEGRWRVRLEGEPQGEAPLPPYITAPLRDPDRYQTVYADEPGSAAAPTAGLHFTSELLDSLSSKGVVVSGLDLQVGPGTFKPVETDDPRLHPMHPERYRISDRLAALVELVREQGGRVWAVGTTVVRALESAANPDGTVRAGAGETSLMITPGYPFRVVDRLLTNFHLPRSTLLMLVSAFAGHQLAMSAYAHAVAERYRFYSYGDAMVIL